MQNSMFDRNELLGVMIEAYNKVWNKDGREIKTSEEIREKAMDAALTALEQYHDDSMHKLISSLKFDED